jgi:hypothetical protein
MARWWYSRAPTRGATVVVNGPPERPFIVTTYAFAKGHIAFECPIEFSTEGRCFYQSRASAVRLEHAQVVA